jgi:prolyl-tRNA synthetase
VLADHAIAGGANWVTGANAVDHHVTGANVGRDFEVDEYTDLVQIVEGDPCPNCGAPVRIERSIVVGHIFELGTKYSAPLKATFIEEDGTERLFQMGCYGIGISRIMAAVVEQGHDEQGIVWPKAVAPFQVAVILATKDDARAVEEAERIYAELLERGVDVLLDDRDERAGVKFADADLIGYPVQVVVGKRGVEGGTVDLKLRTTGERSQAPLDGAARATLDLLAAAP